MPNVYKITFPNGKIYVGSDTTDSVAYTGSLDETTIKEDFPIYARQRFVIVKELLWFRDDATRSETCAEEQRWIKRLQSNNPEIGYNRSPKWRGI